MFDKILSMSMVTLLPASSIQSSEPASRKEVIKPPSKDDRLLMNSSLIINCEK